MKKLQGGYSTKKTGGLKFLLLLFLCFSIMGGVVVDVSASESLNSSLDVNIDFPVTASMNFFTTSSFGAGFDNRGNSGQQDYWSEFDFYTEEPLIVNVENPLDEYSETIEWELQTNYPSTSISFASIGYDGEDYKCLTEPNINEFVQYTIKDFNSFSEVFGPGGIVSDIGFHNGKFKIAYNPELSDKLWCANEARQYRDIILVTIAGEPAFMGEETAFGGDSEGERNGGRWWYYYDTGIGGIQTIWAGQHMDAGTVEYNHNQNQIIINLAPGWELQDDDEAVKIQGYDDEPEFTGIGLFNTYKGNQLNITVPFYQYYVIHLDLKTY